MRRKIVLRIAILVIGTLLVLPVYAFIYNQGTHQVSQTIVNVFNGVEIVQVTGSVPNEMDRRQLGFFGGVFWNPTDFVYQITRIEFDASSANRQVFSGISQGAGVSYPTSGWSLSGSRMVYLTTAINVQPHTVQEFYLKIRGNGIAATFQVDVRVIANGTVYHKPYQTRQSSRDVPFSVVWLGTGPSPRFSTSATKGQETTFYVSLHEDSGRAAIGANGILTIQMPSEFTNIQDIGGTGWGPASITGNMIEVRNTLSVRESYLTFAFKATAPSYKGLYSCNASFNGTLSEQPIVDFSILVTDGL